MSLPSQTESGKEADAESLWDHIDDFTEKWGDIAGIAACEVWIDKKKKELLEH